MAQRNSLRLIKQFILNNRTKRLFLFSLFLIVLLVSIFWPKRNLVSEWQKKKEIEKEINQWEEILKKYPGHRDLYLRLAILNWQIKNDEKAKENLKKAKELDPAFEKTRELENLLK